MRIAILACTRRPDADIWNSHHDQNSISGKP